MRAPAFWWQDGLSLPARALRPASRLYAAAALRRMRRPGTRAALPVVCIGNAIAGGAGKTPTALALAQILSAAGESPAFLSRGYGGRLAGPVAVGLEHGAADVGDEPILLASLAPTVVSRDRPAGARLAHEMGATVLVMDDGLQNPSLAKDCAIAAFDGATGIGNGLVLPAGPLRAPLAAQWPLIDAVLVIGPGAAGERVAAEAERQGKRVFRGRIAPDPATCAGLRGRRVLAFAGIGRPQKFFDTLEACGAVVASARAFPDHHPYDARTLAGLRQEAERLGLAPITTEKDLVRIAGMARPEPWPALAALPVRLVLENEGEIGRFVLRRINERRLRGA